MTWININQLVMKIAMTRHDNPPIICLDAHQLANRNVRKGLSIHPLTNKKAYHSHLTLPLVENDSIKEGKGNKPMRCLFVAGLRVLTNHRASW